MNSTDPDRRKESLRKAAHYRDLGRPHDPDWWLKSLIEREKLTGLGPEALLLKTEDATLDARLDACRSEQEVRTMLQDFNARIIEARRQLQGGPPVVTPLRDVEQAVQRWRSTHLRQATERTGQHHRTGLLSGWITRLKRRGKGQA